MTEEKTHSTLGLIAVPALISLAITILRLVGELEHWPAPFFSTAAGGGSALVGISWLPIIFGPYFAIKLASAGKGPSSKGRAIGFAILGLVIFFVAISWAASTFSHISYWTLVAFLLMLAAAFVPGIGWRALGTTLLAYSLAARIPVLIVMWIAMRGGWETHYSRIAPSIARLSFTRQYLYEALIPQLTLWVGWTVVVGATVGAIVAAIARRRNSEARATA